MDLREDNWTQIQGLPSPKYPAIGLRKWDTVDYLENGQNGHHQNEAN